MSNQVGPLIIFDCDGVLVDSEQLANQVFMQHLQAVGWTLSAVATEALFVGRRLQDCFDLVEDQLGIVLPQEFERQLQAETYQVFKQDLRAVEGVHHALDQLDAWGWQYCVASSGSLEKMQLSLGVCGLLERFKHSMYSATLLPRGKPFPDVFLAAARGMRRQTAQCIVVEDALAGVQAAQAAEMPCIWYSADSELTVPSAKVKSQPEVRRLYNMIELPAMCRQLHDSGKQYE